MGRKGYAAKQKELPGMPKRDALGEKEVEYLNEKEALDTQKKVVERVKEELCKEFFAAGRDTISVEGSRIQMQHKGTTKISVKAV